MIKVKFVFDILFFSIPKVKKCTEKENSIQDPWFYERNFIAEYDGQPAGLLTLKHYGDPEPRYHFNLHNNAISSL